MPRFFAGHFLKGGTMRVLVTALGDSMNASVDERFGRAEYFIIYDTGTKNFEAIKNPFLNDQGGVGVSAAKFTVEKGVDAVISGSYGPNALEILRASSIKLYNAQNRTVQENIDKLLEGKLERF